MAMGKRFYKWPEKVTMRWNRIELPRKVKKSYVWCIWNDLFHEAVPNDFIIEVLNIIEVCPQDTFLVLTKRIKRALECFAPSVSGVESPSLPNLWLGVTVCNQQEADEKIPLLFQTPAAHRWISIEPMLGPVDLKKYLCDHSCEDWGLCSGRHKNQCSQPHIDAVVLGGETGPGARPCHPDWVRSVRDQCAASGVPFFFKSWGMWHPNCLCNTKNPHAVIDRPPGKPGVMFRCGSKAGRLLDDREHNDLPWRNNGEDTRNKN
jgi:protein gp37